MIARIAFGLLTLVACQSATELPIPPPARARVVSYHPLASEIGEKILASGGNAFDAFVATTAAQYVLGEGVTSIGGPLGALIYDAKSKRVSYLDGTFNDPLGTAAGSSSPGSMVLVPGAIAGLEAISVRYGRLPFRQVLEPAIQLAKVGVHLGKYYASIINNPTYEALLKQSQYGSKTFFKDGKPLKEGDLLKLPVFAGFLEKLAIQGSAYAYKGAWAKLFVKEVAHHGGHLTLKDLAAYQVAWREPLHTTHAGMEIYAPSGRTFGGLKTLLALNTLEHANLKQYGTSYTNSADALEIMIRIRNEVAAESWTFKSAKLDSPEYVASILSPEYASDLWAHVQQKLAARQAADSGSHSYQVVVIDEEGNAITGTNTIESMPWGQGLFVEGVPLTVSGALPFATKPGERRGSPLSMEIGVQNDKVRFASGAIGTSLNAAAFQFVVNIVDYRRSAHDTVNEPRFGDQAWDLKSFKPFDGLSLDYRIDKKIIATLESRGLKFYQQGYVDTGLGAVAIVQSDGTIDGAIAPLLSAGSLPPPKEIIGVGLALEVKGESYFVKSLRPNADAGKSGKILVGDQILAVRATPDGEWQLVTGLKIDDLYALIRGAEGTPVALRFKRGWRSLRLS